MKRTAPVVLLSSPPSDPTQSYSALPVLTASLRAQGFEVVQRDLGIELLDHILSRPYLEKAVAKTRAALATGSRSVDDKFSVRVARAAVGANYVIASVEEAKRVMRDSKEFFNPTRYQWARNVIGMTCELASLPAHPTKLYPTKIESPVDFSLPGLLEATTARSDNLFADLFETHIIPNVLALCPLLVGVSVTYHFQLQPALTLTRLLKRAAPQLHVVVGGALIYRLEESLRSQLEWFEFADSFVVGEGETALVALATEMRDGCVTSGIPNLIRLDGEKPKAHNTLHVERAKDFLCPDYDGLDLDLYLSPEPVLLVQSARGCYYGKCTFCDVSRNTRRVYRPVARNTFVENIARLYRRHGVRRFFICDDAVPLGNMRAIAQLVREELPDVTWQGEARFEKTMTDEFIEDIARGGCRQLSFGFESNTQRILDLMDKKNDLANDRKIISLCAAHGIAVNLQTFIGFPTETREEALSTIDFLIESEEHIASFGFGTFALYENTPVHQTPERFNVHSISTPVRHPLLGSLEFECDYGLSPDEVEELERGALERLAPLFATKASFLGGGLGAHTLLYFSHYSPTEMQEIWALWGQPTGVTVKHFYDLVTQPVAGLLLGENTESLPCAENHVFCMQTGCSYDITPEQRILLAICDGQQRLGELVAHWARANANAADLVEEIAFTARAFSAAADLLHQGLLVVLDGSVAKSCDKS